MNNIVVCFISPIQVFNFFLADRFLYGDGIEDKVDQFLHGRVDSMDYMVILVEDKDYYFFLCFFFF